VLTDTQAPFRPSEADVLATAPRAVYQVILPDDPTKGFIVVYELADPAAAAAAAAAQAAYLASGPGRVQSGPDSTVHVIRQVGSTVVLYSWIPDGARDPSAPDVQAALETLGIGTPVPE
jgi:cytochrome c1